MRKNILIIGLALLIIGVILVVVSFYYIPREVIPLISSVNKTLLGEPVSLGPGDAIRINVTITRAPSLIILIYNDSMDRPLSSINTATQSASVSGMYILSFITETNSTIMLGLVNNYTTPTIVKYGYSVIPANSLEGATPFIFMLFIGGAIFIIGLIIAIIGALIKPRSRPSPNMNQ